MFELRWLCSKRNNWERVLQYREGCYVRPPGAWAGANIGTVWGGSAWRDVPDVIEGTEADDERGTQPSISGERNRRPNDDAGVLP